jgi:hypothetical protein
MEHMGQNGRALWLVLCTSAAAAGVAGCGSAPLADAPTTLRVAHDVSVVRAGGGQVPGTVGMILRRGDEILTGSHGSATLATRDRSVFLAARSALRVGDGAHQSLQRGSVLVDAVHGDGETVGLAGYRVSVADGAATRVDAGVAMRVGSLAGRARVTAPGGATLAVPALSQAMLGGDTVPSGTTALHLTDDAAEAAAAPALVRDDLLLLDLARGLDGSGASAAGTVQAAWEQGAGRATVARRAALRTRGTDLSDRVLPVAIARAAGGGATAADYAAAVRWRAQGGSWGVIAHRLGVAASGAANELTALERLPRGGLQRVVAAALAATVASRPGGTAAPGGGSHPSAHPTPGTSQPPAPGSGGSPAPSPAPSPSGGPVGGVTGGLGKTVHKVLKLLPPLPTKVRASVGPIRIGLG